MKNPAVTKSIILAASLMKIMLLIARNIASKTPISTKKPNLRRSITIPDKISRVPKNLNKIISFLTKIPYLNFVIIMAL